MIRAILTDIEGTTTSLSFVKDVLFPYARRHLADFVRAHAKDAEVRKLVDSVGTADDEQAIKQFIQWIDEDSKTTALKALQGLIWAFGYQNGDFHGHVYPDAAIKLQEWQSRGLSLFVFSSGSVHAQKLLFGHSEKGDLNPLFSGYFDTQTGPKQAVESYIKIAEATGFMPFEILFLSDIEAELDAAKEAGMETCQVLREGVMPSSKHPHAENFNKILGV